jgi:hypothetical protein
MVLRYKYVVAIVTGIHSSSDDTRLVSRNHVLDVDVSIFSPVALKRFQRLVNEVTKVLALLLPIIYPVSRVYCSQIMKKLR